MDNFPQVPFKQRIATKLLVVGCLIIGILVAGHWYIYHRSRQMLRTEMDARGLAIAHEFASRTSEHLRSENSEFLRTLSEDVVQDDDVRYAIIADEHNNIVVSTSRFNWQPVVVPEKIRDRTCQRANPVFREHTITDELLYDISIPILAFIQPARSDETLPETQQTVCLGSVHLGLSLTTMNRQLNELLVLTVMMTIIVVLSGVLGLKVVSKKLITPVLHMLGIARKILEGDPDQRIEVASDDELGVLEVALSQIMRSIDAKCAYLKKASDQIELVSNDLTNLSETQIEVSKKQVNSVFQLAGKADGVSDTSQRICNDIDAVVSAAESILQSTQDMGKNVQNTIRDMQEMREQVVNNTERVVLLGEKIAQISNVVKMINTIADHTRLIAFNASIEAAGAGDAGGRFSVVATEVRRLANTVVESVEEIKDSVSSIQTANSELILSSETGIRKVNQGTMQIEGIGDSLQQMIEGLEKLLTSAREISSSMQQQQQDQELFSYGLNDISKSSEQAVDFCTRHSEAIREFLILKEGLEGIFRDYRDQ